MVVNFPGQVRIVFLGRFQYHLFTSAAISFPFFPGASPSHHFARAGWTHLGSIGKLVGREVNLAEAAFPDQAANLVVAYSPEVLG